MDPITLIVIALTFGATELAKGTLNEAGKSAFNSLKGLLSRNFAGDPVAETILHAHEQNPQVYKAPLQMHLEQKHADQDQRILDAAKQLMQIADAEGTRTGKYNVVVSGGQGTQVGDDNDQTNYFGAQPAARSEMSKE